MISGDDPTEAAMSRDLARQARAIRRLRTLADGYRWQRNLTRALRSHDERVAAEQERVRIVAALRAKATVLAIPGEHGRYEAHEVAAFLADAIERGEL